MRLVKQIFLLLLLFSPILLQAQQAVVATGGEATGANGSIQRSSGLPAYTMHSSQDGSIQYGIQQVLETYQLSLFAEPAAGGSVEGEGAYQPNQDLNLQANVNEGYELINWSDEDGFFVSDKESFVYTMPAEDVELTANFADLDDEGAAYSTLALTVNFDNLGTIYPTEGSYKLMPDQTITLTAVPEEGMVFLNWTDGDGNVISEDPEFNYTLARGLNEIQANFGDATAVPIHFVAVLLSFLLAGLFLTNRRRKHV